MVEFISCNDYHLLFIHQQGFGDGEIGEEADVPTMENKVKNELVGSFIINCHIHIN